MRYALHMKRTSLGFPIEVEKQLKVVQSAYLIDR